MYREDLDELMELFSSSSRSVTLSDDKYRYVSLDEMQKRVGNEIKHLDIRSEGPAVHFLLDQKEMTPTSTGFTTTRFNELRTEEISDEADILFLKVREFMENRKRPAFARPSLLIPALVFLFLAIYRMRILILSAPCFLLFLAFVLFSCSVDNLIFLTTKAESPSFWERHKDEVFSKSLASVVSASVGAFVGFFLGFLAHKFNWF